MHIHREGFNTIVLSAVIFIVIQVVNFYLIKKYFPLFSLFLFCCSLLSFFAVIWFFRIPMRTYTRGENLIVAPADGKIVAIKEIDDKEYFKTKVRQVSIFMSPLNVHVQRNPINGVVVYSKYHPGKYLIAFHEKSSELNERHSVVLKKNNFQVLIRQIAGLVARRIVNYSNVGDTAVQNGEMGFIKFGSRVDLFFPLDTKINVEMNQKIIGGVTVIGELN